jgi:hypothetical protein
MERLRRPVTPFVLLALTIVPAAVAAERTASLAVSVQVVARTAMERLDAPETVVLTPEDLAKGYREVDASYRVHASGTSRYLLNIAPRTGLATSIDIEGLGSPVRLEQSDIAVLQTTQARVRELRLRFRMELRPGLAAGTYAFPVLLSVSAPWAGP